MTSSTHQKRIKGIETILTESYKFYIKNKDKLKLETSQTVMNYRKFILNVGISICDNCNLNQDKRNLIQSFVIDNISTDSNELTIKNKNLDLISNNKKNILFVMYNLIDGGAEKALMSVLDNLDYSKYNVDLIVLAKEHFHLYDINENVNVKYVYDTIIQLSEAYLNGKFDLYIEPKYDVEIDYLTVFTAWVIARFGNPKAKKISWIHSDFNYMVDENTVEYVNDLYNRMDNIICVSSVVKQSFIDFVGNKLENKLQTIYNPIDTHQIRKISLQDIEYKKKNYYLIYR